MIDVNNFDAIKISLASPDDILSWSRGEVTKPETINYRTLKPEKDGLFCERIFGPQRDWECYCGKYKRVRFKGIICERCGVEVTRSKVRRERMGHIGLAAPVSHIWYFKGVPSRMGYLLDVSPKDLEKVLYFAAAIITLVDDEKRSTDLFQLKERLEEEIGELRKQAMERKLELQKRINLPPQWWEPLVSYSPLPTLGMLPVDESTNLLELTDYSGNSLFQEKQVLSLDESYEYVIKKNSTITNLCKTVNKVMGKEINLVIEKEVIANLPSPSNPEITIPHKTIKIELRSPLGWEDIEEEIDWLYSLFDLFQNLETKQIIGDEQLYHDLVDRYGEYFDGGMGAEAIKRLLEEIDLDRESVELKSIIKESKGQKRSKAIKRLKVVSSFKKSGNRPEWMIMNTVPVIPPDLRPMVQLDGGRFATSDLNDLYRRVINRNNRLKRLIDLGAPEIIVNNEKRMLQEAVDALFDNGRRGRAVTGAGNRPLKSLSDMLKGKQGRFRQNLLGKRVDYSGRSVIVIGPELKLHQCGLPKIMALELFKPFVMKRLVDLGHAQNIKNAKRMVERVKPVVWDVLEDVITEHPVLLNRAPTLHRLGIQAFEPILVEGKAIQIHPLVCTAFNADFDGDQMAVHLPLSLEAQAEARILMLSTNNILSPANGKPITTPTQDMVLGVYYLTYERDGQPENQLVFSDYAEAIMAYDQKEVNLHDRVKVRRRGSLIETTVGKIILNEVIENTIRHYDPELYESGIHEYINYTITKKEMAELITVYAHKYDSDLRVLILDAIKSVGFKYATQGGVTISKDDIEIPKDKWKILEQPEAEVEKVEDQYLQGFITEEERHEKIVEIWNQATEDVGQLMEQNFHKLNPIFMMANSGARGSFKQIRQLAGMRGLVANPKGEIIDRPVKANFREGLTVLEYFLSTHGARKGLADTALRTADSGYLTRRLVDVCQDVIIREDDCGDKSGMEFPLVVNGALNENLIGRTPTKKIVDPKTKSVIVDPSNENLEISLIDQNILKTMADKRIQKIEARSVLTCKSKFGVCRRCYGLSLANGRLIDIGEAVGIIAAQSIGEPGTQLTMRTFHTGGVAGDDITHGLPRVVELFEARKPKGQAVISEVAGKVQIVEEDNMKRVTIIPSDKGEKERVYFVPRRSRMKVKNDDVVSAGDSLIEGSLNPHDILRIRGVIDTQRYMVDEVQEVYKSQGVEINDKHVELIIRQMLRKVTILEPGDSDFLPGQLLDRLKLEKENKRIAANGGEEATYRDTLLGITKASLATESFLSAASFQETTRVLTEAAISGKVDMLLGLKENVIIGKLIPASTGMKRYRTIEVVPTEEYVRPLFSQFEEEAPEEIIELGEILEKPEHVGKVKEAEVDSAKQSGEKKSEEAEEEVDRKVAE